MKNKIVRQASLIKSSLFCVHSNMHTKIENTALFRGAWYWDFNSRLSTYKAGTLLLEPHLQSFYLGGLLF
jgi:hypothetical protein